MSTYRQFTQHQRYQIEALLKAELIQTEIAEIVNVHKSTISCELKRNKGFRGDRTKQAQRLADERQDNKVQTKIESTTWALIEYYL